MYEWTGSIPGPAGSPYQGGTFCVHINLPGDYPFSAPKVIFTTPLYHPNVSAQGGICVDVLKNAWSPALSLYKVMLSLSSLLTDPNPNDPLVPSIAQEYLKNRSQFEKKAKDWTHRHAMAKGKGKSTPKSSTSAASSSIPSATAITGPPPGPNGAAAISQINTSGGLLASLMGRLSRSTPTSTPTMPTPVPQFPVDLHSRRSARNVRPSPTVPPIARGEVIVIDDDDDEDAAPATSRNAARAGSKRKRQPSIDGSGSGTSAGTSGRAVRRRPVIEGEVIEIDDD